LAAAFFVMAVCVALPIFAGDPVLLALSAAGVGAVALGSVALTSGALAVMVAPNRLATTWGLATMAYAVTQAASAAGFSGLFHLSQSYKLLFAIGAAATLTTAACMLIALRLNEA
jgi:hypothetical protein